MMAASASAHRPSSISFTRSVKCFDSGAMYLPLMRRASIATWGWLMPAGQRDEQMPHITQSKLSSAHFL